MARTPEDYRSREVQRTEPPETLAEMLCHLTDAEKRKSLEQFRIKYEAAYGETDLTKRYTSTWTIAEQEWLMANDIKRYFDGLPPFVKAYFKGKMQLAAKDGNLDDMPDTLLKLYVSGQMRLEHNVRFR